MCNENAGVGVGISDTGRVKLIVEDDEKLHIYSGASCIGQGLGTVLVQMVVTNTDLKHQDIVYEKKQYLDRTGFRYDVRFETDTDHRRSMPESL